jgi:hypothetical protein
MGRDEKGNCEKYIKITIRISNFFWNSSKCPAYSRFDVIEPNNLAETAMFLICSQGHPARIPTEAPAKLTEVHRHPHKIPHSNYMALH